MEMQLQSILVLCMLVVLIMLTFILAILLCCRIDVRVAAITTAGGGAVNTNTIGGLMSAENVEKDGEGLNPDVIENFPMVPYKSIQRLKNVKGRHGCAVCLSEFEIRDTLRMLPGCCHVFHPACIGAWLVSNVTCPICRSDLSDPAVLASDHCLIGDEKEPVMTEIGELEDGRSLRRASSVILIRSSERSSRWDAIVKTLSGRWRKDVSDSRRIAPLFVSSTDVVGSTRDVEMGVSTSSLES